MCSTKPPYELRLEESRKKRAKTIRKQYEWDVYFLRMVKLVASKSEDPNTKIGCVIVGPDNQIVSTGYNGLPRGVNVTKTRLSRENDEKYYWFEHAERNAIYNAARHGIELRGCKAYVYCCPCPDCARALIQVGITQIITMNNHPLKSHSERWKDKYLRSYEMMCEAGLSIKKVNVDDADN